MTYIENLGIIKNYIYKKHIVYVQENLNLFHA